MQVSNNFIFSRDVSWFSSICNTNPIASWARVCPGNNESAGKHKSGNTGHGNHWLRTSLIQASWAAVRAKHNYLASMYHRIAPRRSAKRAIMAVGHCILRGIYFMLRKNSTWQDLGENYSINNIPNASLTELSIVSRILATRSLSCPVQ